MGTRRSTDSFDYAQEQAKQHKIALQLAESELEDINERFQTTFDFSQSGICYLSPNGHWLDVNSKLCDLFKSSKENLLQFSWWELIHPNDRRELLTAAAQMLKNESNSYSYKGRLFRINGDLFQCHLSLKLRRFSSGRPRYFHILVEEILDHKIFETEIRTQNAKLDFHIQETSRFFTLFSEVTTTLQKGPCLKTSISRSLQRLCRFTKWELAHILVLDSNHASNHDTHHNPHLDTPKDKRVLVSSKLWNTHLPRRYHEFLTQTELAIHPEGSSYAGQVLQHGKPLWINNLTQNKTCSASEAANSLGLKAAIYLPLLSRGEVVGIIEFFSTHEAQPQDYLINGLLQISAQLGYALESTQIREAWLQTLDIYRNILQLAFDSVIVTDENGLIISWNQAAEQRFGYFEKEILGQSAALLIPKANTTEFFPRISRRSIKNHHPKRTRAIRVTARKKDGSEIPVDLRLSSFTQRRTRYYVAIVQEAGKIPSATNNPT